MREDFEFLTEDRRSQPIPKSVNVIAPENIFIGRRRQVRIRMHQQVQYTLVRMLKLWKVL
jgi:hypothetical protein